MGRALSSPHEGLVFSGEVEDVAGIPIAAASLPVQPEPAPIWDLAWECEDEDDGFGENDFY